MIDDRSLDRVLTEWFDEGPDEFADRAFIQALDKAWSPAKARTRRPATAGMRAVVSLVAVLILAAMLVALSLVVGALRDTERVEPDAPPVSAPPVTAPSSADPAEPAGGVTTLEGEWSTTDPAPGLPRGRWTLNLGDYAVVSRLPLDTETIDQSWFLWLRPAEILGDSIRFGERADGTCGGEPARYAWTLDGGILRLTPLEETCEDRRAALAGRAWSRESHGQLVPGQSYAFKETPVPFTLVVPPNLSGLEGGAIPTLFIEVLIKQPGSDRSVLIAEVTQMFVDPCDVNRGVVAVSGADAIAERLVAIPGASATATRPSTIGGMAATRVEITAPAGAAEGCTRGAIGFWLDSGQQTPDFPGEGTGHWTEGGSRDRTDLVDVDGHTIAVVVHAASGDFDAWLAQVEPLIESIAFE